MDYGIDHLWLHVCAGTALVCSRHTHIKHTQGEPEGFLTFACLLCQKDLKHHRNQICKNPTCTGNWLITVFFLLQIPRRWLDSCIFHVLVLWWYDDGYWNLEAMGDNMRSLNTFKCYRTWKWGKGWGLHTGMGIAIGTGVYWEYIFIGTGMKIGIGTGTIITLTFSSLAEVVTEGEDWAGGGRKIGGHEKIIMSYLGFDWSHNFEKYKKVKYDTKTD